MNPSNSAANNIGSKVKEGWASKVEEHLIDNKPLDEHECRVAYAAWLHALSERRSRQLGVLSIPTAATALVAALISIDKSGSILTIIGVVAVLLIAAIVTVQLMLTRQVEALKAAAAVHERRASGYRDEPAGAPNGNRPATDSNQSDSRDKQ